MQRNSTKHGPRLDEEMKNETESLERGAPVESRAEEWREQEGAADGEPEPSARPQPDEIAERSEISRHLRLSTFPADRDALLRDARDDDAPEHVLGELARLPAGQTYGTVFEVWEALGHEVEQVTGRPFRGSGQGEHEAAAPPPNREQRRHPDVPAPAPRAPAETSMISPSRPPDEYSVRAKSTGHKKKTADKWNQ